MLKFGTNHFELFIAGNFFFTFLFRDWNEVVLSADEMRAFIPNGFIIRRIPWNHVECIGLRSTWNIECMFDTAQRLSQFVDYLSNVTQETMTFPGARREGLLSYFIFAIKCMMAYMWCFCHAYEVKHE